jgi:signal transduction histidine kinase
VDYDIFQKVKKADLVDFTRVYSAEELDFRLKPNSGIGITEDNQKRIFDSLFHTLDTELYVSKKPYDFCAGGKGLDLFLMKLYGQRFGFGLSVESRRCIYMPKDRDICPGKISACPYCSGPRDCEASGGTTFSLSFQISEEKSMIS